jgi:hypothetical protein
MGHLRKNLFPSEVMPMMSTFRAEEEDGRIFGALAFLVDPLPFMANLNTGDRSNVTKWG